MANIAAPFGFSQWSGSGSAPTYEQVSIPILSTNTTKIFTGDPVSIDASSGNLQQAVAGAAPLAGIFVGCTYVSVSQGKKVWGPYWPGADAVAGSVFGFLINDPNAQWLVQTDVNGPVVQATVGANYQFTLGAGNTLNGRSTAAIVGNSNAVTATLPFRFVDTVITPPGVNGTDITTAYNNIIVAFNNLLGKTLTGIV